MTDLPDRPTRRTLDLTPLVPGERIGHLQVLERVQLGRALCRCLCDCGTTTELLERHIQVAGDAASCGCRERTYHSWYDMVRRCTNPKVRNYRFYGGRGITVCDRWLHSFEAFLADMGLRPSQDHSPDRIDGDGHYEPGNVRWATTEEQRANRKQRVAA
jgi:hypothetical protein